MPLAVVAVELGEMGLRNVDAPAGHLGEDRVHRLHGLVRVVTPAVGVPNPFGNEIGAGLNISEPERHASTSGDDLFR